MSLFEVRLLGPLEAAVEGRSIELRRKQRELLALLALRAGEVVSMDRLVDELWGESPPKTAIGSLQNLVSELRKVLPSDVLLTRAPGYMLDVERDAVDAHRFERLVREARAAPPQQRMVQLREALALWRGPALTDVQLEHESADEAAHLEELRVAVLEDRLEAELDFGLHSQAIGELDSFVSKHPLRERPVGLLMLALYRAGRQSEALETYRRARETLVEGLGIDPSPELQRLEQAILRHDPVLDLPEAPRREILPPEPDRGTTLAGRRGTALPVQPTPLIGRERELKEAGRLLRAKRFVTLTGPGGSGKTRLAIQLATDAAAGFPDGVIWVPLQAVRDPEMVLPMIARALGPGEMLGEELAERRLLLVLDNFEQVLPAAARVGNLVAQLPQVKLLATSREPLHVAAEYEYPVVPLGEHEAVALFMERAAAAKPDFTDDGSVVEICRRVDCLPLSLELAAVLVKALSTAELLKRLDKRLPLLTRGPRDAPERQRTLRATIAWSYELLTADEQRAFARLAVFVGGCTLEAAEQVCQVSFDTVATLIDKNLLRREDDRYQMLETLGEYALERLEESGQLEELRRRHAEHYLKQARAVEHLIRSPRAAGALDELERDHGNLRVALEYSAGTADEPLRLAVWGLAARLHGFGDQALDRRNTSEAARFFRESLEIGLQLHDDMQKAYCLAGLAAVGAERGRLSHAARLWGSVTAFEQTSDTPLHAAERQRYEKVLGELERGSETSADFADGKAMSLDEAVEYALAYVE